MKNKRLYEIVRFCFGGAIAVLVGYVLLYTLTEFLMLWYVLSSVISYLTSQALNFIIQKIWVFKNKESKTTKKQFVIYMSLSVIYFLINTIMIYVLTDYYHIYYILSQVILTTVISIASWFTTKRIFAHKA